MLPQLDASDTVRFLAMQNSEFVLIFNCRELEVGAC